MKLIEFAEQNVVFAKGQPEYRPLPAYVKPNSREGEIVCCWQLTWRERLTILLGGKVWHHVLTFHKPLQPQLLSVTKPDMPGHDPLAGYEKVGPC
jgi:hypothetical protein